MWLQVSRKWWRRGKIWKPLAVHLKPHPKVPLIRYVHLITWPRFLVRYLLTSGLSLTQIRMEEQLAFSDWINTNLGHDPDLKHLLPIASDGRGLFDKVKDGILLW